MDEHIGASGLSSGASAEDVEEEEEEEKEEEESLAGEKDDDKIVMGANCGVAVIFNAAAGVLNVSKHALRDA